MKKKNKDGRIERHGESPDGNNLPTAEQSASEHKRIAALSDIIVELFPDKDHAKFDKKRSLFARTSV